MKKRLFLFSNIFPEDKTSGITKKVFSQIRSWELLGYDVMYYTGYTDRGAAVFDKSGNILTLKPYISKYPLLNRLNRNQLLKCVAAEFLGLQEDDYFDICYIRYLYFDFNFINLLKNARKSSKKVLLEAHSYPIYNKSLFTYYPIYAIDSIWKGKAKKYVDYVIAVVAVNPSINIWGIKTICIENGVDISAISPQNKIPAVDGEVRFISVSYEWLAHGYDRFIKGMAAYYEKKPHRKITLTLIGTIMPSTENLIKKYGLEKYIIFRGKQFGTSLDNLYNEADIGIGALGGFRVNFKDCCALKTREYMAKGIPFIYEGAENKGEDSKYQYRVPSDESPIDIPAILKFYDNLSVDSNMSKEIRRLACKHSWEIQLSKIIAALKEPSI